MHFFDLFILNICPQFFTFAENRVARLTIWALLY